MRRCAIETTGFQQVEVWKSRDACELRVAGAVHAWWHRERLLTGLAWDNLAAGCLLRPAGPPTSILMLGIAGGTTLRILRHLLPEAALTAVDIDPGIIAIARRHMALDACGAEIHIADAYEWARGCRRRFDLVIDDCYLAGEEEVFRPESDPWSAIDRLGRLLSPGGLLALNLVTGAGHRRMQIATRAAFRERFAEVRSVTTWESQNETLVGGDRVLSGSALRPWAGAFPHRRDREFWGRLRNRRIPAPRAGRA